MEKETPETIEMPSPYSRWMPSRKPSSSFLYLRCVMCETACDLMRMMLGEAGQRVAERILARRGSDQALLLREADRVPRPMP